MRHWALMIRCKRSHKPPWCLVSWRHCWPRVERCCVKQEAFLGHQEQMDTWAEMSLSTDEETWTVPKVTEEDSARLDTSTVTQDDLYQCAAAGWEWVGWVGEAPMFLLKVMVLHMFAEEFKGFETMKSSQGSPIFRASFIQAALFLLNIRIK